MFCDNNSKIVKQNKNLIVDNFEVIALHQYVIVRLNLGTEIFFMKVKVCAVWASVISMYLPSQEPCLRFYVHSHLENKMRDWERKGTMLDKGLPAPQQSLALATCP